MAKILHVKATYQDLERAECGDRAALVRLQRAYKASGRAFQLTYQQWIDETFPVLFELPPAPDDKDFG